MQKELLLDILRLRLAIGYLGEENKYNWWNCQFFSPSSKGFLEPVFGRTAHMSAYYGVKEAATKVHDEFIGIGRGVFHLFRLPESIEIELHRLILGSYSNPLVSTVLGNEAGCLGLLKEYGFGNHGTRSVGPVIMGDMDAIQSAQSWKQIAWQYAGSFESDMRVYPYFTERS